MQRDWRVFDPFEVVLHDEFQSSNAPIVTAILTFEGELSAEWVATNFASRIATHPRFRSIIRAHWHGYRFELDPTFRYHHHVTGHRAPLDDKALSVLLTKKLPYSRPFWHLHVFAPADGATEVVVRLHHLICDGTSAARYVAEHVVDKEECHSESESGMESIQRKSELNPELVRHGGLPTAWDRITRPFRDVAAALLHPLIPDPPSPLSIPSLPSKMVVWARTRSIAGLRNASRAVGVTINDLLLCSLAGAMRKYLRAAAPRRITCGVAVNQHPLGSSGLFNAVTALFLSLPIHESNRLRRLAACVRTMRDMKCGYRAVLMRFIVHVMKQLPKPLRHHLFWYASRCASVALTNVRGPAAPAQIAGCRIQRVRVLAGGAGHCGVTLTAFSYGGKLELGLWSLPLCVRSPQTLIDAFDEELDDIMDWTNSYANPDPHHQ